MIVIVNYGMGNIGSILSMLRKIGTPALISSSPEDISKADKLILPGIGAFDSGMMKLNDLGLIKVLNDKVIRDKTPILGICLGMQLFTNGSEEGKLSGLGWIDAETKRFSFEQNNGLKIPHMGWNSIVNQPNGGIFSGFVETPRFYFVHSYYVVCKNQEDILATTAHGYEFTSAIKKENIIGTQFHPEKSHKFGIQLLRNFVEKV